MRKVLDSWAVLAWTKGEQPAAERVRALFLAAERGDLMLLINLVNLGEVYYISYRLRGKTFARRLLEVLTRSVTTVSADSLYLEAAEYKAQFPISYADGFALATAIRENAWLVTGDPEFRALETGLPLKIEWLTREP
jgi:uncharacterized protein